jgi:AcrR family transcriptional regulator
LRSPERQSGRKRGENTRQALLDAAIECFGAHGFSAVSIREVASRADANTAMISYYFGSKEKLYQAAIMLIAEEIDDAVSGALRRIEAELDGGAFAAVGPERAFELSGDLLRPFIRFVLRERSAGKVRLIMREQQDPSQAFIETYGAVMRRMLKALTRLIALGLGRARISNDDRLIAVTTMGQVMVFRCAPAGVKAQMNWRRIGERQMPQIERCILANIAAVLGVAGPR